MRFPPAHHPAWTLAQSLVAFFAIIVMVWHPSGAHHATMPDMNDAAGIGGLALAAKLMWQQFK